MHVRQVGPDAFRRPSNLSIEQKSPVLGSVGLPLRTCTSARQAQRPPLQQRAGLAELAHPYCICVCRPHTSARRQAYFIVQICKCERGSETTSAKAYRNLMLS